MPNIRSASFFTSSIERTTLTPPPLPRPPAWICAFTTQTGPPSALAASTASLTVNAALPRGTGAPKPRMTSLAWYSWIFIRKTCAGFVRWNWPAQYQPNLWAQAQPPVAHRSAHWIGSVAKPFWCVPIRECAMNIRLGKIAAAVLFAAAACIPLNAFRRDFHVGLAPSHEPPPFNAEHRGAAAFWGPDLVDGQMELRVCD